MALTFGFDVQDVIASGRITRNEVEDLKTRLEEESLPKMSEQQLVLFSLSCDRDINSTIQTIRAYFDTKNCHPEIFDNRDIELPELLNYCTNVINITLIPKRSKSGCTVIFMRATDTASYTQVDCEIWLKLLVMCIESGMHGEPPNGLIIVTELNKLGLMTVTKFKFGLISAIVHYLEMGLPLKLKAVHLVNARYLVTQVMGILKRFIKSDVFEKFHVHAPSANLHDIFEDEFEPSSIPEEYGGSLPVMASVQRDTIESLKKHLPYFKAEEAQRRD